MGHVIITSRHHNWKTTVTPLEINVWNQEESLAYLKKLLNFPKEQEDKAKELAKELGYLPLALAQAAAYIVENEIDIEEYLQLFKTKRQELWEDEEAPIHYIEKQAGRTKGEDKTKYTVATTWLTAMEKIEETEGAKELLILCAFLAPDNIPIDIIQKNPSHLPEPLTSVLANPLKRNKVTKALRSYSLVDKTDNDISIHRLVQLVVRDLLTAEQEQEQEWVSTVTKLFSKILPYYPHDLIARQIAQRLSSHAELIAEQAVEDETLATLLNKLGTYFRNAAFYSLGQIYVEKALSINEKALGVEHPDVATSLNILALLLRDQGKYEEAGSLSRRALKIREKILDAEHPDVATNLNNLAKLLQDQGKYEEAVPLFCRALRIREKILDAEHPDVATSLNNLARLLQDQGKYKEAGSLSRRALKIREKVLGFGHPDVANSLNSLVRLLQDQGKYKEAVPLCRKALEIREKVLDAEHPWIANNLNDLAELLKVQGKYEEAEPLFRRAMDIYEKRLGNKHPKTINVRNNLENLLQERSS